MEGLEDKEKEVSDANPVPKWPLNLAEKCGAVLTGKPDGSEPITIVFSLPAWQEFSRRLEGEILLQQEEDRRDSHFGETDG